MSETAAEWLVTGFGVYAGLGLLMGLIYVFGGVKRIDPAARTMPWRARLLILPGVAGLWPLMLTKLFTQKEPPSS